MKETAQLSSVHPFPEKPEDASLKWRPVIMLSK